MILQLPKTKLKTTTRCKKKKNLAHRYNNKNKTFENF